MSILVYGWAISMPFRMLHNALELQYVAMNPLASPVFMRVKEHFT